MKLFSAVFALLLIVAAAPTASAQQASEGLKPVLGLVGDWTGTGEGDLRHVGSDSPHRVGSGRSFCDGRGTLGLSKAGEEQVWRGPYQHGILEFRYGAQTPDPQAVR